MVGQTFEVQYLTARCGQCFEEPGFAGPGLPGDNPKPKPRRIGFKLCHHVLPVALVTALQRVRQEADFGQHERHRPRTLPPTPAIDQRPEPAGFVHEVGFDVPGEIARDQRRADLPRLEGRVLLVEGADLGTLLVAQGRKRHGTGDMIVLELGWRADVDDGVEGLPPVADAGYTHGPVTSRSHSRPIGRQGVQAPDLGGRRVTRRPQSLEGLGGLSGGQGQQQAAAGLRVVEHGAEARRQICGHVPGGGALVTGENAGPNPGIKGFTRPGEQGQRVGIQNRAEAVGQARQQVAQQPETRHVGAQADGTISNSCRGSGVILLAMVKGCLHVLRQHPTEHPGSEDQAHAQRLGQGQTVARFSRSDGSTGRVSPTTVTAALSSEPSAVCPPITGTPALSSPACTCSKSRDRGTERA